MQKGAVAQVDCDLGQGFVHGHPGLPETAHLGVALQGLPEGVPQADADILHGVVLVHFQVPAGLDLQVEIAVGREEV